MERNMKKTIKLLVACAFMLVTGLALFAQDDVPHARPESLITLIAQPGSNKAQKVQVAGFLVLAFEGNALYLHEEDYKEGLTRNAVRISLSPEQTQQYKGLSGNYVWVEASFLKRPNSEDILSGSLYDIREIRKINFKH
jgi:hypothetical protein